MKKRVVLLALLLLLNFVYASCDSAQIDINSASLEDLDKIIYIGSSTAEKIIDARPFDTLDELLRVSGIGEIKLQAIKDEGLACVEDAKEDEENNKLPEEEEENLDLENIAKLDEEFSKEDSSEEKTEEEIFEISGEKEPSKRETMITLFPKDIKTEKNTLNRDRLARIGLIVFGLGMMILFLFGRSSKRKNGFKD
jgi:hypothetical protein